MRSLVIAGILLATLGAVALPATAFGCTTDAECDDGLFCNGSETCAAGTCVAGTSVDCSAFGDQCNDAACTEAQQGCVATPKIDGFGCDDDEPCTLNDTCQGGVCVAATDTDADHDGYCDPQEIAAGCDPADFSEIPPQANVYSGGGNTRGETLATFNAPSVRKVFLSTNPTCATAGVCNPSTRFCTSGKVGDPCHVDGDCNQPPHTCRIVINYSDIPDLRLIYAELKLFGVQASEILPTFTPVKPGCSRKVDVQLPSTFRRVRMRLKATGTIGGRPQRDRDRIIYLP